MNTTDKEIWVKAETEYDESPAGKENAESFYNGAKWALSLNTWVAMDKQLPEPGHTVLFLTLGGSIEIGDIEGDGRIDIYSYGMYCLPKDFTHWIELPAKPKL